MENFIEKIKGLDKKVLIGVGIGAAALIILIIVLVISLGNKPTGNQGGSQSGTQSGTETENGATEVIGTEDATEEIGTEITTETEMGTEVETESESESQSQGIGGTTVTQRPDVNGVEQQPVTTVDGKEVLGDGTANNPYIMLPNGGSTTYETLAPIPAGQTVYYSFRGAGNMWMSINDADAFVIDSKGTRHNASGGKVGFTVGDALASEYVTFQIGNSGTTAKNFTIKFSNIKGSSQNPEVITVLNDEISLSKGDNDGWFYKYTATQSGTIRFYIDSQTKPSTLRVTNNATYAQRDFDADVLTDANGNNYIEVAVSAGDVLVIEVYAKPDLKFNYPATTVNWHGEYAQ